MADKVIIRPINAADFAAIKLTWCLLINQIIDAKNIMKYILIARKAVGTCIKIIFTDEWGGGGRARCRAWDPLDWGADAIYDIVDKKLVFKSHYKMPAPQLETENCVAHNGSIIPIPNRDIFVQAWYQGGISILDFTDSSNPKEIAYFDRGPILEDILITGGYWSTYYYDGFIYGTEITRGLDVFRLIPSEYISKKEIEAASNAFPAVGDNVFNPQQQFPMAWPDTYLE